MDNAHVFFIQCVSVSVCVCCGGHCVSSTPNCRSNSSLPDPNPIVWATLMINNQPTGQTLWYFHAPLPLALPPGSAQPAACCHKYLCNWTHLFRLAAREEGQQGRGERKSEREQALDEVLGRDQSWFNCDLLLIYDLPHLPRPPIKTWNYPEGEVGATWGNAIRIIRIIVLMLSLATWLVIDNMLLLLCGCNPWLLLSLSLSLSLCLLLHVG